jgi:hypothetical protein
MYRYFVADTNAKARRMTLRDDAGRLHVATVPFEVPIIGDVLTGSIPGFGPHALVGPQGEVLRVYFDMVNCGQRAALEELHGALAP